MELQAALALGKLNLSLATVASIIRVHDTSGSGTITFAEFGRLHEFLTNVQQRCAFTRNGLILRANGPLQCEAHVILIVQLPLQF